MKIPDKVRVGSIDYDVTVGEDPLIINGVQALGCCEYIVSTSILVKSIHGDQQLEVTFLHE